MHTSSREEKKILPPTDGGFYESTKRAIAMFKRMPPNPLGFYNFQNHSEWVKDWFQPDFYKPDAYYENPQGPDKPYYIAEQNFNFDKGYSHSIRGSGDGNVAPTYFRFSGLPDRQVAFRCAGKGKVR